MRGPCSGAILAVSRRAHAGAGDGLSPGTISEHHVSYAHAGGDGISRDMSRMSLSRRHTRGGRRAGQRPGCRPDKVRPQTRAGLDPQAGRIGDHARRAMQCPEHSRRSAGTQARCGPHRQSDSGCDTRSVHRESIQVLLDAPRCPHRHDAQHLCQLGTRAVSGFPCSA